ncbi:MAG: hypothetical protein MZV63_58805 [Marinilabiliales bacterium]|nr:hypothetical protein [Marinilabiliales bacterium]
MHMKGTPLTMQDAPAYDDVIGRDRRLPRRPDPRRRGRRHPARAHRCRPGHRLRQVVRTQPRTAAPPGGLPRARPAAPRRLFAQGVPRPHPRPAPGRKARGDDRRGRPLGRARRPHPAGPRRRAGRPGRPRGRGDPLRRPPGGAAADEGRAGDVR